MITTNSKHKLNIRRIAWVQIRKLHVVSTSSGWTAVWRSAVQPRLHLLKRLIPCTDLYLEEVVLIGSIVRFWQYFVVSDDVVFFFDWINEFQTVFEKFSSSEVVGFLFAFLFLLFWLFICSKCFEKGSKMPFLQLLVQSCPF